MTAELAEEASAPISTQPPVFRAMAWVERTQVPVGLRMLLYVLVRYCDENFVCWPAQESLASDTSRSERTVRRQLRLLEDRGLIRRMHRGSATGGRASDLIQLLVGAVPQAVDSPTGVVEKPEVTGHQCPVTPGGYRSSVNQLPDTLDVRGRTKGRTITDTPSLRSGVSADAALDVDVDEATLFEFPDPTPPPAPTPIGIGHRANALAAAYCDQVPLSKFPAVAAICRRAIRAGYGDSAIEAALDSLAEQRRTVTVDSLRIELEGPPKRRDGRLDGDGLRALARRLAAEEAGDGGSR